LGLTVAFGVAVVCVTRMRVQSPRRWLLRCRALTTSVAEKHAFREKGYYEDTHPNTRLAAAYMGVIDRAGIEVSGVEAKVPVAQVLRVYLAPLKLAHGSDPERLVFGAREPFGYSSVIWRAGRA
jgi:hypothetical protein